MDILERIQQLEKKLELYEEENEPEEKMDLKQSIQIEIKNIRKEASSLATDVQQHVMNNLDDFEEILSY